MRIFRWGLMIAMWWCWIPLRFPDFSLMFVLEEEPDDAQAHFALAGLLRDKGDPIAADHHFREYLRVDPKGPNAEEARGHLLQRVP